MRSLALDVVVARVAQERHEPDVAVVLRRGRTLVRADDAQIGPCVRRYRADRDPRERGIPPRRVIGAFPGVIDRDEPGALGIAALREVAVPGEELRVEDRDPRTDRL